MKTIKYKNYVLLIVLVLLFEVIFIFCFKYVFAVDEMHLSRMEEILFGKSFPEMEIQQRVVRLESSFLKKTFSEDPLESRIERLDYYLFDRKDVTGEELQQQIAGYENIETKKVTEEEFLQLLVDIINEERSFNGLFPLVKDAIASKVAEDQAQDIVLKGYLTHFNLKKQGPDERYTLSGGTGALTEVIKGFQISEQESSIVLTTLLAKQLVQAIKSNSDDALLINNSQVTHIGIGSQITKDKKGFVSVIEFVIKGGDFEPLKPVVSFGDKLDIQGRVNKPYKFKAISVGYLDNVILDHAVYKKIYFDNEGLKPYFPPEEYIAYGDTGKSNFAKFIKGLGIVGAIGAAPFTGGASAILAPVLLSSFQGGTPREIPLKGGINAKSNGEFLGAIDLNYQGKSGLYFINVLAEKEGVNYSLVISRRAVRVVHQVNPGISTTRDRT